MKSWRGGVALKHIKGIIGLSVMRIVYEVGKQPCKKNGMEEALIATLYSMSLCCAQSLEMVYL